MAEIIYGHNQRSYINRTLAPAIIALSALNPVALKTLDACYAIVENRVNNQPQPPADWSREVPEMKGNEKSGGY